jgi:uncharacterized membrane protein SirB2
VIAVTNEVTRTRSRFYVVMAAAIAITVFVGFAPTFYLRSSFNPDKTLSILLHVHGVALSTWIVLFLVQTILIVQGSPALHRRLGWVMLGLAGSIVLLMGAAIVEQLRRTPAEPPAPFALAFGVFDIIVFATLVSIAIRRRNRPDWHKRLMLSATILLIGAAAVRFVAFHGVHEPLYLLLSQFCTVILFFIPCFAYDWVTRRKIHRATIVGLALILADQIIQPIVLSWPAWTDFATAIQRLVA